MTSRNTPFTKREIGIAVLVGGLFLLSAYLSNVYENDIEKWIGVYGMLGQLLYVLLAIFATVIAPASAMPLIPIATALWGPWTAGLLSLVGWTLGALIAFTLARKLGYTFVSRFAPLHKIQVYADHVPNQSMFWTVVFLRIVLPVDLLSYALGLFSKMKTGAYILATVIGVTPFAFAFSYTSKMPYISQIALLMIVAVFLYIGYSQIRSDFMEEGEEEVAEEEKHKD